MHLRRFIISGKTDNKISRKNEIINKNIFVFIIITAAFVGISIIVIWFTSRVITRPIYKLIKSAEKIAEGEELKIDNSKRNT